jgi:hypothetical protein
MDLSEWQERWLTDKKTLGLKKIDFSAPVTTLSELCRQIYSGLILKYTNEAPKNVLFDLIALKSLLSNETASENKSTSHPISWSVTQSPPRISQHASTNGPQRIFFFN